MTKLTRPEMVALIRRLQNGEGDDAEASGWLEALERSVPDPHISDLIFFCDEELTAEQIIDRVNQYRPIEL